MKFPNAEMLKKIAERYPVMTLESQETFMEVILVAKRLSSGMDAYFQCFGLSHGGYKTLMCLFMTEEEGGLSPAMISELLGVTRATMTGVLDTLENHGWITRTPDPSDRRSLLIQITEAGRSKLDTILPLHYQNVSQCMSLLSDDEQRMLKILMKKFGQSLDALEECMKNQVKGEQP